MLPGLGEPRYDDVSAIDFHVAPCVLAHLQRNMDVCYNASQLRTLMWVHGSRTNVRDTPEDAMDGKDSAACAHWRRAQRQLQSLQRFLVKQNS